MAAGKIRAIIFDIGRVLVRIDVHRALAGLAEKVASHARRTLVSPRKTPSWIDWQEGRITPRDFYLSVTKRFCHHHLRSSNLRRFGTASSIRNPFSTTSFSPRWPKNIASACSPTPTPFTSRT